MEQPLTIRCSWRKWAWLALGGAAFVIVGLMMLSLEPPQNPVLGWSTPAGRFLQTTIGVLALVFGGLALAVSVLSVAQPLLLLYPDRIVDVRRKLSVPFSEIRSLEADSSRGFFSVQWLRLTLRNTQTIVRPRFSAKQPQHDPQLTLDLSLASESDFVKAQEFIQGRLGQADSEG